MAADNPKPRKNWFLLDASGNRHGPFSLEQIQKQLRDGKISSIQRVTAEHLDGETLSVAAALEHLDPAHSLFHTLQTARQLKQRSAAREQGSADSENANRESLGARTQIPHLTAFIWVLGIASVAIIATILLLERRNASDSARIETVKSIESRDSGPPQFTRPPGEGKTGRAAGANAFLGSSRPAARLTDTPSDAEDEQRPRARPSRWPTLESIPNLRDPSDSPVDSPQNPTDTENSNETERQQNPSDQPDEPVGKNLQPPDSSFNPNPADTPPSE